MPLPQSSYIYWLIPFKHNFPKQSNTFEKYCCKKNSFNSALNFEWNGSYFLRLNILQQTSTAKLAVFFQKFLKECAVANSLEMKVTYNQIMKKTLFQVFLRTSDRSYEPHTFFQPSFNFGNFRARSRIF